jgi:CheY-like chemotaxis protein
MVAKSPADRFPAMTELIRALEGLKRATQLANTRPAAQAIVAPADPDPMKGTVALEPARATSRVEQLAETRVAPPTPGAGRFAGRTVVLAEPSRTQAGIVRRYLEQLGIHAVHTTGSGREALDLARRHRAGIVISSMHLADMTGAQLAQELLADRGCDGVGFVLATSEADGPGGGAVPDSPRVDLVHKPYDLERLARSIATVAG